VLDSTEVAPASNGTAIRSLLGQIPAALHRRLHVDSVQNNITIREFVLAVLEARLYATEAVGDD